MQQVQSEAKRVTDEVELDQASRITATHMVQRGPLRIESQEVLA